MIARSLLQQDDFLWALDHSRRRYRVRHTRCDDLHPLPIREPQGFISVVRIRGGAPVVMAAQCGISPGEWIDSDAYAEFRLLAINRHRPLSDFERRS